MGEVIGVPGLNFRHFRQSNAQEKLEDGRGVEGGGFWQDGRDLAMAGAGKIFRVLSRNSANCLELLSNHSRIALEILSK